MRKGAAAATEMAVKPAQVKNGNGSAAKQNGGRANGAASADGAAAGMTRKAAGGRVWLPIALLVGAVWSFWPTLRELGAFWQANDDYSVGQLVPVVALILLYQRLKRVDWAALRPSVWGLAVVAVAQLGRIAAVYYGFASGERYCFLLTFSGLVLVCGGWALFRRLLWVQVFLLLMIPLPGRIHNLIAMPLQEWATTLGVFGLELLGYFVETDGNVLTVNQASNVMVAEACSGLRMLTAFIFTAAVLCFLLPHRPVWQKVTLLLSSVPVAVLTNGLRVMATAMVIQNSESLTLEKFFHDFAGVLMMPVAVLVLFGELKFLGALTKPETPKAPTKPRRSKRGPGVRAVAAHS